MLHSIATGFSAAHLMALQSIVVDQTFRIGNGQIILFVFLHLHTKLRCELGNFLYCLHIHRQQDAPILMPVINDLRWFFSLDPFCDGIRTDDLPKFIDICILHYSFSFCNSLFAFASTFTHLGCVVPCKVLATNPAAQTRTSPPNRQ